MEIQIVILNTKTIPQFLYPIFLNCLISNAKKNWTLFWVSYQLWSYIYNKKVRKYNMAGNHFLFHL